MEKILLKEILKSCAWYEKIIVIILKKLILNIYKRGIKKGFNLAN